MANYLKKRNDNKKRETMIVFVYDTEFCQDEADDPVEAVLYFHPSWVSDTQKLSLCGQLMGTTHFLKECFFKPKLISLQNGKFVLKEFGRFILAVGTDRNLSDSLLQHRAELLTSLLKFFHRDIQTIYDQFSSLNGQYKNLSEKLYHIFETYLPILQYNGNIFQNMSTLRLPKSASNIFLDAMQTLQSCQQTKGVLGGTILYHNKVVATQLSPEITKNLILTDPFHIKSTAEPISVDFHVPIGVQLLIVYISSNDYHKLQFDAQKAQNIVTQNFSVNGASLPFQFQMKRSKIKRDKSLIFTNIPEEGQNESTVTVTEEKAATINTITTASKTTDISKASTTKPNISRPNHLPLKFKNVTSKEIPESGFVSINFDESDSYAEFIGRTSVCSTPMTENKILQYDNIMSICANPQQDNLLINNEKSKAKRFFRKQSIEEEEIDGIDCSNEAEADGKMKKFNNYLLKVDFDKFFTNFIHNPHKKFVRRNSFTDLQDSLKKLSKRLTMKSSSSSSSLSKENSNNNNKGDNGNDEGGGLSTPDFVDDITDKSKKKKMFRTITDPMYPVFNSDGEPISKSLFQEFVEKYYKTWNNEQKKSTGNKSDKNNEEIRANNVDNDANNANGDEDDEKLTKLIEEFKEFDSELTKYEMKFTKNETENDTLKETLAKNVKQTPNRKSLSLPLKPLNDSSSLVEKDNQFQSNNGGIFERKKHSGIQLTPLMAKLSILALNEERSSGFSSWDTTPGMELATPNDAANKGYRRRSSTRNDDIFENPQTTTTGNQFQKVELYICGQQNMTLLLLLEEGAAQKQNLVQAMFDICVSKLIRIETQLNQTLNVNVDGDKSEGGYSYIYVDPKWDTLQRGGPWSIMDLDTLEHVHKDLNLKQPITDLLLRTEDSVLYGYKCGLTELFYKQSAQSQSGLPPPADIMGTISMRAKRRLERDHSLILF